ncbi:serine hydrolase domain-containing protein [uncultured Alteromonas sp.]|jgi:CubicO group peptidase (beta-lactamase class C family)|uniref:serine hydrolase domain-containing protein n=1 Tax=uncultured Alteromonas sp. TaxID=179113 RepID=UPI002585A732|nr:serine hydrolase domain-containing protein [uncultured Alteromonas sp.]|tara:strand:- start:4807 stop:5835 length:1029 start_codon:yes stop_codon:yes gene_type:complete
MMKKRRILIIRITLLVGTIISLFFVPWILVMAWVLPLPDTIQEQVDEAIASGFDGMIVYVDEAGKPPVFYTGGWKDRVNRKPADSNSLFKIASISKLYTAVAVTKLAKEKRLLLDAPITDYLPELKGRIANSEKITLKMMVQHRSGIPNFTDNPAYWQNEIESDHEALNFALDLPPSFDPDEGYQYSNTNYLLLRNIMDKVLGYSHHQYIKDKILIPLELNNTYFSLNEVNLNNVMSGYYVGYEEDFKSREYGMLATAEDVGIFLRALNDGSVFEDGEEEIYPYVYEHGGLVVGYQSLAKYNKELDAVVVQFINTTDFDGYEWNLSEITINRIIKILGRKNA